MCNQKLILIRFSNHPAIALPGLEPYAYGNVFYERAKALLGSMLGLPRRETVAAFVLLAHMGFAADSESEVWMLTGCAVRMAIDCGLHVAPPDDAPEEERRRDRLVFWSVLLMDYALAFGVGRQTAFRPDDITQAFPSDEDVRMASSPQAGGARSPFPFAARMMLAYGPLINALNRAQGGDAHAARADAIKEYNRLPEDMTWNVTNLQRHSAGHNGPIFLHLHLWMHTVIVRDSTHGAEELTKGIRIPNGLVTPLAHVGRVDPNKWWHWERNDHPIHILAVAKLGTDHWRYTRSFRHYQSPRVLCPPVREPSLLRRRVLLRQG